LPLIIRRDRLSCRVWMECWSIIGRRRESGGNLPSGCAAEREADVQMHVDEGLYHYMYWEFVRHAIFRIFIRFVSLFNALIRPSA
jgi:hypothetical protein